MKMTSIVLSFLVFGLAYSATASDYKIEVCKININALPGIHHVFVRGSSPVGSESFNFGPKNRATSAFGTLLESEFTKADHPNAECITVFASNNDCDYLMKWSAIEQYFMESRNSYYHAYGVRGKNCGMVTREAVESVGLVFPFDNINGQDNTAQLLYSVGDMIRGDNSQQKVEEVVSNLSGAVVGIINNSNRENCVVQ